MKIVEAIPRALHEYFHDVRCWSFDMRSNLLGDYTIEVMPVALRKLLLTEHKLAVGNKGALFEHIVRGIEAHQGDICDELDRSIRREPRPETKEEHRGRCRYCGAPWEPEERRVRR